MTIAGEADSRETTYSGTEATDEATSRPSPLRTSWLP